MYACWRKCDFQVHTPRDPGWQGKRPVGLGDDYNGVVATANDMNSERRKWAAHFVDCCMWKGLQAVAITDHHEMTMVSFVQEEIEFRKAQDESFDLWLFPGMELTCHGGKQCIILFDADLSLEWRQDAQSKLGISIPGLEESAGQAPKTKQLTNLHYPDISELLDRIPELKGRYIVLPNVSQGGRHTVNTDGAHADFKRMKYVGGYLDNCKNINSLSRKSKQRLSGEAPEWGDRVIYPLPTSDVRCVSYSSLGGNNCWMKLAEPTAEAIRQAFLGYKSRISIEQPSIPSMSVASVSVDGSVILENGRLSISPELNAFIGGRGSGKSTYLEYIAFALGMSCYDLDKKTYSGSYRLRDVIQDTVVTPGASIEVDIVQDGAKFTISRKGANAYSPIVTYPNGKTDEPSVEALRGLFPTVVYSQGELAEIGKKAGEKSELSELLKFVRPEYKKEDDILKASIQDARQDVRNVLQSLQEAWRQKAKLDKLKIGKHSLEERISALKKTLPALSKEDQAIISLYDDLVELDAKRQQIEKQVNGSVSSLEELRNYARKSIELDSKHEHAQSIKEAYSGFNDMFSSGVEGLLKSLMVRKGDVKKAGDDISSSLEKAKEDRDKAMEKLTAHKTVTTQLSNVQKELEDILSQIGNLELDIVLPDDRFEEYKQAIGRLKEKVEERKEKTVEWVKKIEELSSGRIKAEVNVDSNWSEIIEATDCVVAKTGSKEAIRLRNIENKIQREGVWSFLDEFRGNCLAALRWKEISHLGKGSRPSLDMLEYVIGGSEQTLTKCLELIDLIRVQTIATAVPKPNITLYYCDADRKIAFEKASEGQRAAALLFILLEQEGGPLIVDQPEGDLDNKIVSDLAETLHKAKQKRQIIFASHNANIVVNGSSELVVGMDVTDSAKRKATYSGAIDSRDIREAITETMEGGEKAFRERKEKYGF